MQVLVRPPLPSWTRHERWTVRKARYPGAEWPGSVRLAHLGLTDAGPQP